MTIGGHLNWFKKWQFTKRPQIIVWIAVIVALLSVIYVLLRGSQFAELGSTDTLNNQSGRTVHVLSYSSFLAPWGPGPTLKKIFEHEYNLRSRDEKVRIEYLQSEDAGLLLSKLSVIPADLVIGFDQFTRVQAKQARTWRRHGLTAGLKFSDEFFLAFDWAPIGFVYRLGEVVPPSSLDDLLAPRFRGLISLQDPRTSSPGYQFLAWIVAEKGEAGAREYLARLKPNIHSVSGSWATSYGLFTRGLAKLVFSYVTSPLYHRFTEKDERYRFAPFLTAHPVQVEYAAIPSDCKQCDLAHEFAKFLISSPAQQVIMNKNWMLPISSTAAEGTAFGEIMDSVGDTTSDVLKIRDPMNASSEINRISVLRIWEELKF